MQVINFDQSYSPVAHTNSFNINIAVLSMHILTVIILDVINAFHNPIFSILQIVCAIIPPYYLDCFETSYPNVPLDWDNGKFFSNVWI